MNTNMYGRVVIPYVDGDEVKEVEIGFKSGFDFWGLVEEHDAEHGTDYFELLNESNVIVEDVRYHVSQYRVQYEMSGEILWERYFDDEYDARMYALEFWDEHGYGGKRAIARKGNIAILMVDVDDEHVPDELYIELYQLLWEELYYADLDTHFEIRFLEDVWGLDDEDRGALMQVFYTLDKRYFEANTTPDLNDEKNIFDMYYEVVA